MFKCVNTIAFMNYQQGIIAIVDIKSTRKCI